MTKRGYKSVINESKDLEELVHNLNAYNEIESELIEAINKFAIGQYVTEAELKRDYGFSKSSLRLLERYQLLIPASTTGKRKAYDLAKALRIRIRFPGLFNSKNVRTTAKHNNIVTIFRNYCNKITDLSLELAETAQKKRLIESDHSQECEGRFQQIAG